MPHFGMALRADTGGHGGQVDLTETLTMPHPVKGRYSLTETVYGPTIVALGKLVCCAEELVRERVQDDIPVSRGERGGAGRR